MKLSDKYINKLIKSKKLIIDPIPSSNRIHGITCDILLGNKFRVFQNEHNIKYINLNGTKKEIQKNLNKIISKEIILSEKDFFLLHPGELVLAITLEYFIFPTNLVGWIDGRSSLARLGLMVHITSHRIDPGWRGCIVLECFNASKVTLALQPGMIICSLSFEKIKGKVLYPYNNRQGTKYSNQKKIIISRIEKNL